LSDYEGLNARQDKVKFSMRGRLLLASLMRTPSAKFCYFFDHTKPRSRSEAKVRESALQGKAPSQQIIYKIQPNHRAHPDSFREVKFSLSKQEE
jgi:hypothetical protein